MKIPNNHLVKILGMNIGQNVEHNVQCEICEIDGATESYYSLKTILSDKIMTITHSYEFIPKILKRSLLSITKNHLEVAARLQGFIITNDFDIKFENGQFKWDDGNTWGQFLVESLYFKTYQVLYSLGYALPITILDDNNKPITYTTEQLIESGVYKIR